MVCFKYLQMSEDGEMESGQQEAESKTGSLGLPWWSSGYDSALPEQGAQV